MANGSWGGWQGRLIKSFSVLVVEIWKSSATGLQIEPKERTIKVPIFYLEHLVLVFVGTIT